MLLLLFIPLIFARPQAVASRALPECSQTLRLVSLTAYAATSEEMFGLRVAMASMCSRPAVGNLSFGEPSTRAYNYLVCQSVHLYPERSTCSLVQQGRTWRLSKLSLTPRVGCGCVNSIITPKTSANCCFGGVDGRDLLITANDSVWLLKTLVKGAIYTDVCARAKM